MIYLLLWLAAVPDSTLLSRWLLVVAFGPSLAVLLAAALADRGRQSAPPRGWLLLFWVAGLGATAVEGLHHVVFNHQISLLLIGANLILVALAPALVFLDRMWRRPGRPANKVPRGEIAGKAGNRRMSGACSPIGFNVTLVPSALLLFGLCHHADALGLPSDAGGQGYRPADRFVLVKGGVFQMSDVLGDAGYAMPETPAHEVRLGDFYPSKCEVTVSREGNRPGDNHEGRQFLPSTLDAAT